MPLEVLPVPIALSAEAFPGLPGDPWYVTCRDEANRLVSEYTASPSGLTRTKDYFYFGNLLVASEDGTGNFTFYVSDHLGTMRLETDAVGRVVHHDYLPYGEEMDSNVASTPIKFAGMERDASSGNDYDHARFSLTGMGRFGSVDRHDADPNDPATWNRYTYSGDNPLRYVDPNGLVKFASVQMQIYYNDAVEYLGHSAAAKQVVIAFEAIKGPQEPTVAPAPDASRDSTAGTDVWWAPNSGLDVAGQGGNAGAAGQSAQTPALELLHEMGHYVQKVAHPEQYAKDSKPDGSDYDDKEEKRDILSVETPAAKQLGEPTRKTHGGAPVKMQQPMAPPSQTKSHGCQSTHGNGPCTK